MSQYKNPYKRTLTKEKDESYKLSEQLKCFVEKAEKGFHAKLVFSDNQKPIVLAFGCSEHETKRNLKHRMAIIQMVARDFEFKKD